MKKLLILGSILMLASCADTPEEKEIVRLESYALFERKLLRNVRCVDGIRYFMKDKFFNGVKFDKETLKPHTCDWIWEK